MKKIVKFYCVVFVCTAFMAMPTIVTASNSSIELFNKFKSIKELCNNTNENFEATGSNYVFDWAEVDDGVPDVEMVKAESNCATTPSTTSLCAGSNFTVTHGTPSCCDGNARLRYYNGYTGLWTDGAWNTDQYTSSISGAEPGTYNFQTQIIGVNGDTYCSTSTDVIVDAIPAAVSVSGAGTYCGSATLTATGGSVSKTIGTGTSTTNTQPVYSYYNYSRSCHLILRSELAGQSGVITHLAVYVGTAGTHNFTGISIRLKKTTATTAPTTFPGDGTQVWTGSYTFSSTGWVTFDITDFNWDSDNLLIEWQHGYTAYTSNYPYFRYTTTSTDLATYAYNDSNLPTTGTNTTTRPNYQLTFANIYWQNTTSNGTSAATLSTSQTVTSSGTYYFRARSSNANCWSTQGSAAVIINTAPTAPTGISVSPSGTSICPSETRTLSATGGSTGTSSIYEWYSGDCGTGTFLGNGASLLNVNAGAGTTTSYYVRRVGTSTCTNVTGCAGPTTITVGTESVVPSSINAVANP